MLNGEHVLALFCLIKFFYNSMEILSRLKLNWSNK
nr:MAG TPA: hypothetical protein [Caudoviricetes sp.]